MLIVGEFFNLKKSKIKNEPDGIRQIVIRIYFNKEKDDTSLLLFQE